MIDDLCDDSGLEANVLHGYQGNVNHCRMTRVVKATISQSWGICRLTMVWLLRYKLARNSSTHGDCSGWMGIKGGKSTGTRPILL